MTDLEFKGWLDALAAFPQQLQQTVRGLDERMLRFKPAPNEWSITEVIGHLIDIDILMAGRIGQIIARDNPALTVFDVDAEVLRRDYQNKQANLLLVNFAERRAANVEEWRYIRPANLQRAGMHPTRGALTIAAIIGTLPPHDQTHMAQIRANLAAARS
jgi:hypothetical protein